MPVTTETHETWLPGTLYCTRQYDSQNIDVVLEGCADVDVWDIYSSTPLHEAVEGDVDIAELLGHGAGVSALALTRES